MQFCRHAAASPRSSSEARGQAQEAPTQRRGPQAEVDRRRLVYRHGQRDVRRWTGGDAAAASCQLPLPHAHNKATRQAAHSQEKYTNTSRHPVVSLSASVSTASRQCRPGRCVCRPSPCPAFFVRRPRRRWHRLSDTIAPVIVILAKACLGKICCKTGAKRRQRAHPRTQRGDPAARRPSARRALAPRERGGSGRNRRGV